MVSVIVVMYNSADCISSCLESLCSQEYKDLEIIAYDNGSSDGTLSIVQTRYPQVKVIAGSENIGFAAANNAAAALAQGEFLAFINPDTVPAQDWVTPLVDALQREPRVGAVTSQVLFADPSDRINACGNAIHFSGVAYCYKLGERVISGQPLEVPAVSGAAFALRRAVFEAVGGFEERFFLYYEDADLSLRLRRAGWRILAVPCSLVWHDYRSAFSPTKVYHLERNRYLSLLSLLPRRMLAIMIPCMMLAEMASWGYCLLKGTKALTAKARAWRDILNARAWIAERRQRYALSPQDAAVLLDAFTPHLRIEYIGESNRILARVFQLAAWMAAAPLLALARAVVRWSQTRSL